MLPLGFGDDDAKGRQSTVPFADALRARLPRLVSDRECKSGSSPWKMIEAAHADGGAVVACGMVEWNRRLARQ